MNNSPKRTIGSQPMKEDTNEFNKNVLSSLSPRSIEQLQEFVVKTPCGAPPKARYSFEEVDESKQASTLLDPCDVRVNMMLSERSQSLETMHDSSEKTFSSSFNLQNPFTWLCPNMFNSII